MSGVGDAYVVAEWRHARWFEPHEAIPVDPHLRERGRSGVDPLSATCETCGEALHPSTFAPFHPPRPERVVKAEALREAYDRSSRGPDAMPLKIWIAAAGWLQRRAERIEAGDLP